MDVKIELTNNCVRFQGAIKDAAIAWLHEACGELQAQVMRNTKVKSSKTKGSWQYRVDESTLTGYVGSDYENAIWEEYGTGEFALNGDGRKGGWWYKDEQGNWHFTFGKRPRRMLFNAFNSLKATIQRSAEERFGSLGR